MFSFLYRSNRWFVLETFLCYFDPYLVFKFSTFKFFFNPPFFLHVFDSVFFLSHLGNIAVCIQRRVPFSLNADLNALNILFTPSSYQAIFTHLPFIHACEKLTGWLNRDLARKPSVVSTGNEAISLTNIQLVGRAYARANLLRGD